MSRTLRDTGPDRMEMEAGTQETKAWVPDARQENHGPICTGKCKNCRCRKETPEIPGN